MMDRFTTIFFGKWFVLLFFGAQSYWQVDGLLKDASTGRVIETLSWIALSVLLFFIAWKIGWSNLRALGTKAQRRRRRLAVITAPLGHQRLAPPRQVVDAFLEMHHFVGKDRRELLKVGAALGSLRVEAVDGVDIDAKPGQIVAL